MKQDGLTRSRGQRKQPKNRLIIGIASLIALLIVTIGGLVFYRYQQGSIEGQWRNTLAEKQVEAYTRSLLQESLPQADDSFFTVEHHLQIQNQKAKLTAQARFDISHLASLTVDYAYAEMLKEFESEAASQNLSLKDYLTAILGEDYEQSLKSLLPNQASLEENFHRQQEKEAQTIGANYDRKTGVLSLVYFEGQVNPFSKTITVKKVNKDLTSMLHEKEPKIGEKLTYTRTGKQLQLHYNQSNFILEN